MNVETLSAEFDATHPVQKKWKASCYGNWFSFLGFPVRFPQLPLERLVFQLIL